MEEGGKRRKMSIKRGNKKGKKKEDGMGVRMVEIGRNREEASRGGSSKDKDGEIRMEEGRSRWHRNIREGRRKEEGERGKGRIGQMRVMEDIEVREEK